MSQDTTMTTSITIVCPHCDRRFPVRNSAELTAAELHVLAHVHASHPDGD